MHTVFKHLRRTSTLSAQHPHTATSAAGTGTADGAQEGSSSSSPPPPPPPLSTQPRAQIDHCTAAVDAAAAQGVPTIAVTSPPPTRSSQSQSSATDLCAASVRTTRSSGPSESIRAKQAAVEAVLARRLAQGPDVSDTSGAAPRWTLSSSRRSGGNGSDHKRGSSGIIQPGNGLQCGHGSQHFDNTSKSGTSTKQQQQRTTGRRSGKKRSATVIGTSGNGSGSSGIRPSLAVSSFFSRTRTSASSAARTSRRRSASTHARSPVSPTLPPAPASAPESADGASSTLAVPSSMRRFTKGAGSSPQQQQQQHQHLIHLHQQAMMEHMQTMALSDSGGGGVISSSGNTVKKLRKSRSRRKRRNRRRNALAVLPDELLLRVFHYVPLEHLARSVSLVSRRFAVLWVQGVVSVRVEGNLRRLSEDDLIRVVRRFVRLESLDVNNSGSAGDYQLSDKGLLQLAHKYIYSSADYLTLAAPKDPLTGEFDFHFDYDTYLESLDAMTDFSEVDADLDSAIDDELSYGSVGISATAAATAGQTGGGSVPHGAEGSALHSHTTAPDDDTSTMDDYYHDHDHDQSADLSTCTTTTTATLTSDNPYRRETLMFTTSHSHYFYPPPRFNRSGTSGGGGGGGGGVLGGHPASGLAAGGTLHRRSDSGDPSYGLHTLSRLNLLGCSRITENGVKYLNYICQNLRHLCLKGCTKVNDQALAYIAEFAHLEHLDLTGCTHVTDAGLHNLSRIKSRALHTLDLTFCHQITDSGISALSRRITSLSDLSLQCCGKITHVGVESLLRSNVGLRSLNLTGCALVELCLIDPDGDRFPALETLNLMGCKRSCDRCLETLCHWTGSLRELVLAYSDSVTDRGIAVVVQRSPHLARLNLKRCSLLTDASIASLVEHCAPSLECINLTTCHGVSDAGLSLLPSLPRLRELHLRKCFAITDAGLLWLRKCHSLDLLDISELSLVSDNAVRALCASLCAVHGERRKRIGKTVLNRCTSLSADAVVELKMLYGDTVEV